MNLLLIDGLPGSGKSSLAKALGSRIEGSLVWDEMDSVHPLHVVRPGELGASFEQAYEFEPQELSGMMIERWKTFVSSLGPHLTILESYPFQSEARLLLQMDAPGDLVLGHLRSVESLLTPINYGLIILTHGDVRKELERIAEIRGPDWADFVDSFMSRTPWAIHRSLSGREASYALVDAYVQLTQGFLKTSKSPCLKLPGGPFYGPNTVESAFDWTLRASG